MKPCSTFFRVRSAFHRFRGMRRNIAITLTTPVQVNLGTLGKRDEALRASDTWNLANAVRKGS